MKSHVLGIDLGGTKVSAAVVNGKGRVLGRARAKTEAWRGGEKVLERVVSVGCKALEKAGISADNLAAVGIGAPGPIDFETGYIVESANLKMTNFPLGPRLAEEFGCPTAVDNDVNAGIYGEFRAGAARGSRDILGVFIGTGIGGGLILNGKLYHGYSKNAGEVGHIIIEAGGPLCGCGNRGCLEAVASRVAITQFVRDAIDRGRKTVLAKHLKRDVDVLSSQVLKSAYDEGDEITVKIMNRAARLIGMGLGSLVNLLGPELIVLGGGVIEAMGDDFVERIDSTTRKIAFEMCARGLRIVRAELGDDAGMVGAAMLAREALAHGNHHQAPLP